MDSIPSAIAVHKRKAWKPITSEGDGKATASKFSGIPWLAAGEEWPVCPNCHKPMQLFVQLNLDDLPREAQSEYGSGLLQMFYCTTSDPLCEVDCEAFFPFSKSTLLRIVQAEGEAANLTSSPVQDAFPAKTIEDWAEMDDYPNPDEANLQGFEMSEAERERLYDYEQDYPHGGDKLAGWPFWVQGVEYPNCPQCGKQMLLLFQIDSEDNLPYMFGDSGCGHITQCPTHKDQLAFGWACA